VTSVDNDDNEDNDDYNDDTDIASSINIDILFLLIVL